MRERARQLGASPRGLNEMNACRQGLGKQGFGARAKIRLSKIEHSFICLLRICVSLVRRTGCGQSSLFKFALACFFLSAAVLLLAALSLGDLAFTAAASAQPTGSQPTSQSAPEPLRREILALYDSREESRPDQTRIHRFAEMPLNHLGLVVTYWDINAGL